MKAENYKQVSFDMCIYKDIYIYTHAHTNTPHLCTLYRLAQPY